MPFHAPFRLHRACFYKVRNFYKKYHQTRIQNIGFKTMTNYNNAYVDDSNNSQNKGDCNLDAKVNTVFELFNKLFEKHCPEDVFVSFNGGKDCTVVLDLFSQYLKQNENLKKFVIPVLYIRPLNPFREVENFVEQCAQNYQVEMIQQQGSIKPVLEDICKQRPNLKVVLMGLRRTDPFGRDMKYMQPTDPSWPPLLRVNPILDWTYKDVWDYIQKKNVPYCSLYDMGYTSLGETTNTKRNKHLRREDPETADVTYLPAYKLLNDKLERDGRF